MSQKNNNSSSTLDDHLYQTKIEISSIKVSNLKTAADPSSHNNYLMQFILNQDQIKKTSLAKNQKNPEWNESLNLFVTLEEEIMIQVMGEKEQKSEVVGQGLLKVQDLSVGKQELKVELSAEGKSVGQVLITFNAIVNKDYSKQSGIKGKLIISNINADLKNDTSSTQCVFTLEGLEKNTSKSLQTNHKTQWNDTIIYPVKNDLNLNVKVINSEDKSEELGSGQTYLSVLVDRQGIFAGESIELTQFNNSKGTVYANLEFRPFDFGDDKQLYDLQRIMGRVKISNISARLDRDTDQNEKNGKMDPYCNVRFHDKTFKTVVHQDAGSEPKWSESFTLDLFTYQKNSLLVIDIMDKDPNSEDLVGTAVIELSHFLSSIQEYPNQEVEVQFQQRSAGAFFFTATSQEDTSLKQYLARKEQQDKIKQKQLEEEEEEQAKLKKQQDEAASALKKKQQEDEEAAAALKKKQEKEAEAAEANKKKQDQEAAAEANKKKLEAEATEANKKKLEAEAAEEKKRKQEQEAAEANKKKQEDKESQKAQEEEENRKKQNQESKEEKNEDEDEEKQRKQREEKENEEKQQEEQEKLKKQNDKSIINDSKISKGSRRSDEYIPAIRNLKNGFGLSEFQSAHTLQTSIHSTSFPKSLRFSSQLSEKNSSSYFVLPSPFDKGTRGPSFGYGVRGLINPTANPGPGTYELSQLQKNGLRKGYIFGESREHCKNSINTMKSDMAGSKSNQSLKQGNNYSSGLKLPSIYQKPSALSNIQYSSYSNNIKPNYHYLNGSQSVSSLKQ